MNHGPQEELGEQPLTAIEEGSKEMSFISFSAILLRMYESHESGAVVCNEVVWIEKEVVLTA